MDPCQINNIHSVNGRKIGAMISLENLFGQGDHFLNRNVKFVANSFEKGVDDVEIHN